MSRVGRVIVGTALAATFGTVAIAPEKIPIFLIGDKVDRRIEALEQKAKGAFAPGRGALSEDIRGKAETQEERIGKLRKQVCNDTIFKVMGGDFEIVLDNRTHDVPPNLKRLCRYETISYSTFLPINLWRGLFGIFAAMNLVDALNEVFRRRKREEEQKARPPRNKGALIFAGTMMAIGAGLFIYGKDMTAHFARSSTKAVNAVKNDGVCHEIEAYECVFNESGVQKRDEDGKCREPNPHFSKLDCHWGDLICDDGKEKLLDRDGNVIELENPAEAIGDVIYKVKPIKLPLETRDSPDCQMKLAKEDRCQLWTGDNHIKNRNHGISVVFERWKTPPEILKVHGGSTELDDRDYRAIVHYEEVCAEVSEELPLCDPDEPRGRCACPNLPDQKDCGNRHLKKPHCRNGRVERDKGEQCDPGSAKGKAACGPDRTCTKACACVEDKQGAKR